MAAECYFIKLVNFPTHSENIVDDVFTNQPSFVNCCTVVPGVSDHDAVLITFITEATAWPLIRMRLNIKVLWNRANFEDMRVVLSEFSVLLCNHYCNDSPVDFYGL